MIGVIFFQNRIHGRNDTPLVISIHIFVNKKMPNSFSQVMARLFFVLFWPTIVSQCELSFAYVNRWWIVRLTEGSACCTLASPEMSESNNNTIYIGLAKQFRLPVDWIELKNFFFSFWYSFFWWGCALFDSILFWSVCLEMPVHGFFYCEEINRVYSSAGEIW